MACRVQLWIVSEDAVVVEWDTPRRSEIRGNSRTLRDSRMQPKESRIFPRGLTSRVRERVLEAGDHLKHRKINICELCAQQIPLQKKKIFLKQHPNKKQTKHTNYYY